MTKYYSFIDQASSLFLSHLSEGRLRRVLKAHGLTGPAADDMKIWDVILQVREANPSLKLGSDGVSQNPGRRPVIYPGSRSGFDPALAVHADSTR